MRLQISLWAIAGLVGGYYWMSHYKRTGQVF